MRLVKEERKKLHLIKLQREAASASTATAAKSSAGGEDAQAEQAPMEEPQAAPAGEVEGGPSVGRNPPSDDRAPFKAYPGLEQALLEAEISFPPRWKALAGMNAKRLSTGVRMLPLVVKVGLPCGG